MSLALVFSFPSEWFCPARSNACRCEIVQNLVVTQIVVAIDEGLDSDMCAAMCRIITNRHHNQKPTDVLGVRLLQQRRTYQFSL